MVCQIKMNAVEKLNQGEGGWALLVGGGAPWPTRWSGKWSSFSGLPQQSTASGVCVVGGCQTAEICSHNSGGRKSKIKVWAGWFLPRP